MALIGNLSCFEPSEFVCLHFCRFNKAAPRLGATFQSCDIYLQMLIDSEAVSMQQQRGAAALGTEEPEPSHRRTPSARPRVRVCV